MGILVEPLFRRRQADGFEQFQGLGLAGFAPQVLVQGNALAELGPDGQDGICSDKGMTSRPSQRIWPLVYSVASAGSNFMAAWDVTDLPQPDSPTMPTVSPGLTVSDTSWIASSRPR